MNTNDGFTLVYLKDNKLFKVELSELQENLFQFSLANIMLSSNELINITNDFICELPIKEN